MFIIRKNQTNDIVATASQNRTLNNPYYLFSFTHILSREQFAFIPQVISSNTRYDKFRFVESPNENLSAVPPLVTFPYLGQYYYTIYEQVSPSNLNPALAYNEVENGRAVVVIGNDQEPSCFFEQFVSDNETNENIIFISEQEQECLTVSPSVTPTNTVTPSITPTNTVTPTITPSQTPTLTPTPSCPVTTQYLQTELTSCNAFRLSLWNDSGFTQTATAQCNYSVSGVAFGDLGTIYTGTEVITTGQHQHTFNLNPILQPGECVKGFGVISVNTSVCTCPVIVEFENECRSYNIVGTASPSGTFVHFDCYLPGLYTTTITSGQTIQLVCALENCVNATGATVTELGACLPNPLPSNTPTMTPSQTPTMTPSSTPPLSFSVCSGTTKNDACNCATGGGTSFLVYAQNLGNCAACSPLNCWACLTTSQQVYLDSNLTIPVGNGYYTNSMDGAFAWGTWNIIGGYPQGGGFSSGCP